jgi:hypothetical protein
VGLGPKSVICWSVEVGAGNVAWIAAFAGAVLAFAGLPAGTRASPAAHSATQADATASAGRRSPPADRMRPCVMQRITLDSLNITAVCRKSFETSKKPFRRERKSLAKPGQPKRTESNAIEVCTCCFESGSR